MAQFIKLNHVKSSYNRESIINRNETLEPIWVNIETIEHVANINKSDFITQAKGYVRTKNCDFSVAENAEQIMSKINEFNA